MKLDRSKHGEFLSRAVPFQMPTGQVVLFVMIMIGNLRPPIRLELGETSQGPGVAQ